MRSKFTEPKTNRGRRTVDLDPETVGILRKHRSKQLSGRLLWGEGHQDQDLRKTIGDALDDVVCPLE